MTFSQPQIYYILDNIDEAIKYDGNALLVNRPQLYYGGTNTFFKEFCNVQFDGISISFIGGLTGKNISVSIDRLDPSPEVVLDTAYSTWYQSELLLEGSHSINITLATNIESSLDFMSVEPGLTTNLTGKTLIMDDTYPAIQYGGDWEAVMYSLGVVAFQSNSHHTSTAGSNLTFTYVGSDMTVYGLYDTGSAGGSFELKSTVDSNPSSTQTFTGNLTSKLSWGNHITLFTTQELSLEPGQHTVTLELANKGKVAARYEER
ncbi:hypothetical protein C8J56DRAFT_1058487 [Mycena floridula]|nr:hypothetical protein C8J56DRAFT_1058487 [Mycena floridula]